MTEPEPKVWKTYPADYEPVEDALSHLAAIAELLATAVAFADLEDEPPGLQFQYLQEAAAMANALRMALLTAAGFSQRACEAAHRARGFELCNLCKLWLPASTVSLQPIGHEVPGEKRTNHQYLCSSCLKDEEAIL